MFSLNPRATRRTFLAGLGAAGVASIAACGNDTNPTNPTSNATTGASQGGAPAIKPGTHMTFILPGDVPSRWDDVLAAVNEKLKADLDLTFDIQWTGWANYADNVLLKFTAAEEFSGALEAGWLHMARLAEDEAIYPIDDLLTEANYPNLVKTIDQRTIDTSKFFGKLWGVPQVNAAAALMGFMVRTDLGDPGQSYADFEKYLYDVKAANSSVIPYGLDTGYVNETYQTFDEAKWNGEDTHLNSTPFPAPLLFISKEDAAAGNANIVPVWEVPHVVDAFRRVRKYHNDNIINHDSLSADKTTVISLFGQGKYAATIGITDGLMTAQYGSTRDNVAGSELALILPFGTDDPPKQLTGFGSGNYLSFNQATDHLNEGMALSEWLSIKENHDLLAYGVEGTDWEAPDDMTYKTLSDYVFPGYTMCWRAPLERFPDGMIETDRQWAEWSRDFDNFELSPLAGFNMNSDPVQTEIAKFNAILATSVTPLLNGSVDTDEGIEKLKGDAETAGLTKVVEELQTQLGEFFSNR